VGAPARLDSRPAGVAPSLTSASCAHNHTAGSGIGTCTSPKPPCHLHRATRAACCPAGHPAKSPWGRCFLLRQRSVRRGCEAHGSSHRPMAPSPSPASRHRRRKARLPTDPCAAWTYRPSARRAAWTPTPGSAPAHFTERCHPRGANVPIRPLPCACGGRPCGIGSGWWQRGWSAHAGARMQRDRGVSVGELHAPGSFPGFPPGAPFGPPQRSDPFGLLLSHQLFRCWVRGRGSRSS